MINTICGMQVVGDLGLSYSEMEKIIGELAKDWAWEGKQFDKVEMISDGQVVHVYAYEKPLVKVVLKK